MRFGENGMEFEDLGCAQKRPLLSACAQMSNL